jgi:hypothetical protein
VGLLLNRRVGSSSPSCLFYSEIQYNIRMNIKLDRLSAFNQLRKGPCGKARMGCFSFRDRTKYTRKGRKAKNW